MWKQLFDPHNIFVMLVLGVLSAGWLIGRLDTSIAVPIMLMISGIGVGASVFSNGAGFGVPLTKNAPLLPTSSVTTTQSEIVSVPAPVGASG